MPIRVFIDCDGMMTELDARSVDPTFAGFRDFCTAGGIGLTILGDGLDSAWRNTDCARCACCKRNLMLHASGDDDIIVYAGDGVSDPCPVRYADIVFARGELQRFCQQENITWYLFPSFAEVTRRLGMLAGRRRLRPRREAERLRRGLFIAEGEPVP